MQEVKDTELYCMSRICIPPPRGCDQQIWVNLRSEGIVVMFWSTTRQIRKKTRHIEQEPWESLAGDYWGMLSSCCTLGQGSALRAVVPQDWAPETLGGGCPSTADPIDQQKQTYLDMPDAVAKQHLFLDWDKLEAWVLAAGKWQCNSECTKRWAILLPLLSSYIHVLQKEREDETLLFESIFGNDYVTVTPHPLTTLIMKGMKPSINSFYLPTTPQRRQ